MDKGLVSSQAARHRYLCPGTGINPRVSPASLPEKPSIDAQAGSNPNETNSSFASMIGSAGSVKRKPNGSGTPHTTFHTLWHPARRLQLARPIKGLPGCFEACDSSMCCHRFSSSRSAVERLVCGGVWEEFEDSCVRRWGTDCVSM